MQSPAICVTDGEDTKGSKTGQGQWEVFSFVATLFSFYHSSGSERQLSAFHVMPEASLCSVKNV